MLLASTARRPTARRVATHAAHVVSPSAALVCLGAAVSAPGGVLQAQQPAPPAPHAPAASAAATVVSGVVRDAAGAPVERAIVRLVPVLPDGSTAAAGAAAQTDRRGAFRLTAAPGRQVLRAWRAASDTAVRTLDLASGDSVDVTLVLRDADRPGAATLAAVRVRANATSYRADTAATATRTPTPLRDLPQAVQVVTGAVLRDQQALLLTEALRNVAGATTFSGYNDLTLRGFRTTPGNFALNGQRGGLADSYGPQVSYAIERVEVLKGPASVLFGNAAPGGVVNVVQKLPQAVAARTLEVSTGSFGLRRAVADATGPLDARGTWRYRLVAGGEDSDSFMRFVGGRNWLVSPALTWAPSARTEITAVGSYFRRDETGGGWYNRGILAPGGDVNALPRDWSGHEAGDRTEDRAPAAQLLARHALAPNVSLHLLARAGRTDYRQQYHHLNWGGLAEDGRTLSRHFRDFATDTDERVVNAYATAQGRWLGVGHTAVVGVDANDTRYAWTYAQSAAGVPTLDILAPVYGRGDEARYRGDRYSADNVDRTRMLGGYVQDQLDLAPVLGGAAVKALVGVRWERYRFRNTNVDRTATVADPAAAPSRSADASDAAVLVPRVGLVYQPTRAVSLYTNYSESFEPQYSNLPLAGGPFPPERGRQVEVGVKHDLGSPALDDGRAVRDPQGERADAGARQPGPAARGGRRAEPRRGAERRRARDAAPERARQLRLHGRRRHRRDGRHGGAAPADGAAPRGQRVGHVAGSAARADAGAERRREPRRRPRHARRPRVHRARLHDAGRRRARDARRGRPPGARGERLQPGRPPIRGRQLRARRQLARRAAQRAGRAPHDVLSRATRRAHDAPRTRPTRPRIPRRRP
jgi:iron complex outermembrane receptor protein